MNVSAKDWEKYRDTLGKISQKAADEFTKFSSTYDFMNGSRADLIKFAHALTTKYGEAAGSLAAQYYDEIAKLSKVKGIRAAVVADTADISDVAKAVNGCLIQSPEGNKLGQVIYRLVKQVGADTTLQNAKRDGAQFAWIPDGGACAFCIALASRGWQYMSREAMDGDHAEHIHANCNCEYAIRFDTKTTYRGYNPDDYKDIYDEAEGRDSTDKLNSIRRMQYAEVHKD